MTMPTMAPPIVPDSDTVPARYPSQATTTLTRSAHGRWDTTASRDAANASALINDAIARAAAAVTGTEMLSSRRTGIVSTSAAAAAAASGARNANLIDGGGVTAGRVHSASATAAAPPHITNAIVPATV